MSAATAYPDLQPTASSSPEVGNTGAGNLSADDRLLRASEVQRELGISRVALYRKLNRYGLNGPAAKCPDRRLDPQTGPEPPVR